MAHLHRSKPTGTLVLTPKTCGHAYCHLTISTCCACTDERPLQMMYYQYVDGLGTVKVEGTRTLGYCPACRVAGPIEVPIKYPPRAPPTRTPPKPSHPQPPKPKLPPPPPSRATCSLFSSKKCGDGCYAPGTSSAKCCLCALLWKRRRHPGRKTCTDDVDSFCDLCRQRVSYRLWAELLEEAEAAPAKSALEMKPLAPGTFIRSFVPAAAAAPPAELHLPKACSAAEERLGSEEDDDWSVADVDLSELESGCSFDDGDSLCSWVDAGRPEDDW